MKKNIQRTAEEVKSLSQNELEEFLFWLSEYDLQHQDEWDKEIEQDTQTGGRLDTILKRVRSDIAAGKIKPLE